MIFTQTDELVVVFILIYIISKLESSLYQHLTNKLLRDIVL